MLWRKRTKEHHARPSAALQEASRALNGWLRRWALWLQAKASRLPPRAQKAGWLLFTLLFMGWSAAVLYGGITGKAPPKAPPSTAYPLPQTRLPLPQPPHGEQQTRRLLRLRAALDSLDHTERGRRWRDSTLTVRPRLADTLAWLKRYYSRKH